MQTCAAMKGPLPNFNKANYRDRQPMLELNCEVTNLLVKQALAGSRMLCRIVGSPPDNTEHCSVGFVGRHATRCTVW